MNFWKKKTSASDSSTSSDSRVNFCLCLFSTSNLDSSEFGCKKTNIKLVVVQYLPARYWVCFSSDKNKRTYLSYYLLGQNSFLKWNILVRGNRTTRFMCESSLKCFLNSQDLLGTLKFSQLKIFKCFNLNGNIWGCFNENKFNVSVL